MTSVLNNTTINFFADNAACLNTCSSADDRTKIYLRSKIGKEFFTSHKVEVNGGKTQTKSNHISHFAISKTKEQV